MRKTDLLRLIIFLLIPVTVGQAQLSSLETKTLSVDACFEKYFPPAYVIGAVNGDLRYHRCTLPSQQLCDISAGIKAHNYRGVACLNDAGFNFNVEDGIFSPLDIPLFQAAFYDSEILNFLFSSRTRLNLEIRDRSQETALFFVTSIHSSGMLDVRKGFSYENAYRSSELLLNKGADPDPFWNGKTPLILQAEYGHEKLLELLLRYKANPNFQTPDGETALMLAADRPEVVNLLITEGANIYLKDNLGKSAIFYAVEGCQVNKALSLLKLDPDLLSTVDFKGRPAADYASSTAITSDCRAVRKVARTTAPGGSTSGPR
jgi:ankyrin repeat protein